MSTHLSHIIEKLTIEVQTNSKKLAYSIKDEKDVFFLEELMALLGDIFDENSPEYEQLVRLDTINIELDASSKDFEFDIKRQLQEKLATILPTVVFDQVSKQKDKQMPASNSKTAALLSFFKTGDFPWWFEAPKNNSTMDALIYECLDNNAFTVGVANSLEQVVFKRRCIAQLSDGFLSVLFGKLINQKYGVKPAIFMDNESLLASIIKKARIPFWSFMAQAITSSNKDSIAGYWIEYLQKTTISPTANLEVVKQLNDFTLEVLTKPYVKKNNIPLLGTSHGTIASVHSTDNVNIDLNQKVQSQETYSSDTHTLSIDDQDLQVKDANRYLGNEKATENKKAVNKTEEVINKTTSDQKTNQNTNKETAHNEVRPSDSDKSPQEEMHAESPSDLTPKAKTEAHKKTTATPNKEDHKAPEQKTKEKENAKVYKKGSKENSKTLQTSNQDNVSEQGQTQDVQSLTNSENYTNDRLSNGKNNKRLDPETTENQQLKKALETLQLEQPEHFYAAHCGLVLLHPFLSSFLKNCDLLDHAKQLKDPTLTAHLLHYVATGNTAAYEHQLQFERFICHIPAGLPLERHVELSQELIAKADELLQAMLGHLPQLKSSEPKLLQNEFLSRDGKVVLTDENPRITIERKTQDMLLDSKPWSTSIVKLPWLPYLIFVDW